MAQKKLYTLLPEHEARFPEWRDRWIANAMSTKAMDDEARQIMRTAIAGLYRAANLEPPPERRIVFVPSPFVGTFAAGFAAWIWWRREHGDSDATDGATRGATDDATDDATDGATRGATAGATDGATDDAGSKSWWALGNCDEREIAKLAGRIFPGHQKQMLECAQMAWKMGNGGNQWSAWCAFLTFFRYVALLDLDYSKWDHYEKAAVHAGPRWMHSKFCIVSDRPSILKVDDKNRPHCDDGPFCEWRDGSQLYSIHGVRVSGLVVEQPSRITAEMIEENQDENARQVMLERCPPAEASLYTIRKMKAAG